MKDLSAYTQGGVAVTFPAWGQLLTEGWQVFVGVLGAVVLCLTIYNKVLEAIQRRRDLKGR